MSTEYERCLVEQPLMTADGGEDSFPATIFRKCCPYKSCRNVDLYRAFEFSSTTGRPLYGYKRGSNDEWFYGPASDLAELAEEMNHRDRWPVDEAKLEALFARHNLGIYEDEE